MPIEYPLITSVVRYDFMKADGSRLALFDIVIDQAYSGLFHVPRIGETINYTPRPDPTQYIGEVFEVTHSIVTNESPLGATIQYRLRLKNSQTV